MALTNQERRHLSVGGGKTSTLSRHQFSSRSADAAQERDPFHRRFGRPFAGTGCDADRHLIHMQRRDHGRAGETLVRRAAARRRDLTPACVRKFRMQASDGSSPVRMPSQTCRGLRAPGLFIQLAASPRRVGDRSALGSLSRRDGSIASLIRRSAVIGCCPRKSFRPSQHVRRQTADAAESHNPSPLSWPPVSMPQPCIERRSKNWDFRTSRSPLK